MDLAQRILLDVIHGKSVVKYAYCDQGGIAWHTYQSEEEHRHMERFMSLQKIADCIVQNYGSSCSERIVDIGPGDGIPSSYFMQGLEKVPCYEFIDISGQLGEFIHEHMCEIFNFPIEKHICDFSDSFPEIARTPEKSLYLLLGNTLANLDNPQKFLAQVHQSMQSQDLFVIENDLHPLSIEETIKYYERGESFARYPLTFLGITPENSSYQVSWDDIHSCIVVEIVLHNEFLFKEQVLPKRILITKSWKPTRPQLEEYLIYAGFIIASIYDHPHNSTVITCQKKDTN
jgi:hypothetical protein